MNLRKSMALVFVLGATSCGHVPIEAQEAERKFPLTIVTQPAECAGQGGCFLVSAAVLVQLQRDAIAKVPSCRREGFI